MKFQNCEFYPVIMSLYEELISMNEPFNFEYKHSKEWLTAFKKMTKVTKMAAHYMWPDITVNPKEIPYDYERFRFSDTLMKILKYYKPEKGDFDRYFITTVRNDVFRQNTHIKIQQCAEHRFFQLSKNAQKKINKCIHIVKKYNKEHPDEPDIRIYDTKAQRLFMDQKVFISEKSMEKYLLMNWNSFHKQLPRIDSAEENLMNIRDNLPDLFTFMDECYMKKINLKKQNEDSQLQKEIFLKKVLTCHYYLKYRELQNTVNETEWNLISLMKRNHFYSAEIIKIFQDNDRHIEEMKKEQKADSPVDIKKLIKAPPVTVEKISLESGKPFNYGYRVVGDFRKYVRKTAELRKFPEEILRLI